MAIDVTALIQRLREAPEERAALRQLLVGDQPDLAAALASLTDRVEALAVAQQRTEERLGVLAERVDALAVAQQRTEERVDALAVAQQRTEERLGVLAERVDALAVAQQRTEARLDALVKDVRALAAAQRGTEESVKSLVDVVKGMNDRLGKLDGDSLQRRYREKGPARLSPIARRLRLVDQGALSAMVDDAERAERITAAEAFSIFNADAIFSGRLRRDDTPVHLVLEVSVTIARHDVRRARDRADLFARVVDTPVIAVVAGEFAPEPVTVAAQDADVWQVTNGKVVTPDDDLDLFLPR